MTTKQFVTFYYLGIFMSEESSQEVESRDVMALDVPDSAFAFEFWERTETEVDGEALKGQPKNRSGRYYPEGRVMSVADVLVEDTDNRILVSNMENNGWDHVVKTRRGNYQPFLATDRVIYDITR